MRSDILLTPKWKQETLVSIELHCGNMCFLLCLEILRAHSLSGCVSGNPALSLGEHASFPDGGSIFVVPAF